MTETSQNLLTEQYDSLPYPRIPIEELPTNNYKSLFIDDLTTSYYLYQQKVINPYNQIILDVGCGSGWTTLNLAFANPHAKVVAIDLSQNSLNFARKRLDYHNVKNVEFHQIAMENIHQLGYQYNYINCEDVLYFSNDPVKSLKALQSVLKPDGIIRGDFHSYYQRFYYYQSQELFRCLGLFDSNPDDFEIEVVAETMKNLQPHTILKRNTGSLFNNENIDLTSDKTKQSILMNHLIQDDKGFTIPQIFELLAQSNLAFLSMVNWRQWDVRDLFKDRENIPTVWEFVLENASEAEKLHLFELLHPCHRLIDFWCVNDNTIIPIQSPSTWSKNDWQNAIIHLHPQFKYPAIKEDLLNSIRQQNPWEISKYITLPTLNPVYISSNQSALLLFLWDKPRTFGELVNYWLRIQPIDLATSQAKTIIEAEEEVKDLVQKLEIFLYLLVENTNIIN